MNPTAPTPSVPTEPAQPVTPATPTDDTLNDIKMPGDVPAAPAPETPAA